MDRPTYKVRYRSVDGYRESRTYKTISGARRRIVHFLGEDCEVSQGGQYAVASDGVGICRVEGARIEDVLSLLNA